MLARDNTCNGRVKLQSDYKVTVLVATFIMLFIPMEQQPNAGVLKRTKPVHILLICWGAFGSVIFNFVYFSFGILTPNYDELRQPIGRLELVAHGWIQSANFIFLALCNCLIAIGLKKLLAGGFGSALLPFFHVSAALALVLMGLFISEPAHTYVSMYSFLSILGCFLLFARRFKGDLRWPDWVPFTNICTILMVVTMLIFWYSADQDGAYAGIFERLLEITRLVWYVAFALKLLYGRQISAEK